MHSLFIKKTTFVFVLGFLIFGLVSGVSAITTPGTVNLSFSPTGAGTGFMPNAGHLSNPAVRFYAKLPDSAVFLTDQQITYRLLDVQTGNSAGVASERGWVLREKPIWDRDFTVKGHDPLSTGLSVFKGPVEDWRVRVPLYRRLSLGEVAEGVQMILTLVDDRLEKIFSVNPGAHPGDIRFEVEGAAGLRINAGGELEIITGLRTIRWSRPVAYQWVDGRKKLVKVAYAVSGNRYGFTTGRFDRDLPLVIDPILACAGLGGDSRDAAFDVIVASGGDVYVAGVTQSADFPTTAGAYVAVNRGDQDIFVARLDADLSTLKAAAIVGGSSWDASTYDSLPTAMGLALDASGNVFLGFATPSDNCPVLANSWDKNIAGIFDGYICKLNADLTSLLGATYFGGGESDKIYALAVDTQGHVFAAGWTSSSDMPTTEGAYDRTYNTVQVYPYPSYGDVFAAKFDNDLTSLLAGTYLGGGGGDDYAAAMALDNSGNVHLTGCTKSLGTENAPFPTTPGAFQTELTGLLGKGFVSVLDNRLATLSASTFLGGVTGTDSPRDIALGPMGVIAVTGSTESSDFPVTLGAYQMDYPFADNGFVSILNQNLTGLEASTYLGGGTTTEGYAYSSTACTLGFDSGGNVWVGGITWSPNFPMVFADNSDYGGNGDAFISRFSPSLQQLQYSSFLGGSSADRIYALAVDSGDGIVTAGLTYSANFPYTPGAYHSGDEGETAFVARVEPPQVLTVDVSGPQNIEPGGQATFLIRFFNGMETEARNVILTFDIPLEIEYVSSSNNSFYRSDMDTQQVFWKLGNLEPNSAGSVSVVVGAPFGLPGGNFDFFTNIAASNFNNSNIDVDEYLNLDVVKVVSETNLNQSQINEILSSNQQVKELADMLDLQGYHFYNTGVRKDLDNGNSIITLSFLAPNSFSPTLLTFDGEKAFAEVFNDPEYSLFDTEGGYTTNESDGMFQSWGTWAESGRGNRDIELKTARCQVNCTINNVPSWFAGLFSGKLDMLMNIQSCIKCKRSNGAAVDDCAKCAAAAAKANPGVAWAVDVAKCLADCLDDPNLHICTEDKVKCCTSVIGWLGGFGTKCRTVCNKTTGTYDPIDRRSYCDYFEPYCRDGKCVANKCSQSRQSPNTVCKKTESENTPAHDPNAKSVNFPGDVIPGQTLTYTIEYENVGAGTAYQVFILDDLDENLDASTLVINNSGAYTPEARLLSWDIGELPPCTEENPDVCKGSVSFSIKVKNGLASGTNISNFAEVHFPSAGEITPTNPVVSQVNTIAADPKSVQTVSKTPVAITMSGRDTGSGTLTYRITADPLYGTLSGTPPNVTYTSMEQFSGIDEFYYVVNNGLVDSSPARVAVAVEPNAAEKTAPTIAETWPQNGATSISASDTPIVEGIRYLPTLTARFSEPMKESTITNTAFTVAGIEGVVYYDASTWTAYFYPSQALNRSTAYTATISTAVEDLNGNKPAGAHTWTFTTDSLEKEITTAASPTTAGIVTGGGTYSEGTTVTVSATANTGWIFVNWTEGDTILTTNSTYTFTAGKSRTLTANFKKIHYVGKKSGCGGMTPCYTTIQAALDAAADGEVIWVGEGIYDEAPVKNTAGSATICGGWDDAFNAQTSRTTSLHAPSAPNGAVILNEVVITP